MIGQRVGGIVEQSGVGTPDLRLESQLALGLDQVGVEIAQVAHQDRPAGMVERPGPDS